MANLTDLLLGEPALFANETLLELQSLGRLASCSQAFREACSDPRVWRGLLARRWGAHCEGDPRAALAWLETDVRSAMQQSFKRGFHMMLCEDAGAEPAGEHSFSRPLKPVESVNPSDWYDAYSDQPPGLVDWEVPAVRLLGWLPLQERRKLASFACHDSVPYRRLDLFLRQFSLADTPTPEHALRQLLFRFPFLPIDAGSVYIYI